MGPSWNIQADKIVPIGLALIVMCLCPCWHRSLWDHAHGFGIDSYVHMSLLTSEPMRSCLLVWHWELPAYVLVDIVAKIMPIGVALIVSCFCTCWHWNLWDRDNWFEIDSASDWIRFKLRSDVRVDIGAYEIIPFDLALIVLRVVPGLIRFL